VLEDRSFLAVLEVGLLEADESPMGCEVDPLVAVPEVDTDEEGLLDLADLVLNIAGDPHWC
jgi:hypothetical protein